MKVKVISLRQNLLKGIDGLLDKTTLVELDLYDNELVEIPDFSKLDNLEYVILFYFYNNT